MTATIVVDLDGPILDTRRRHHACYARILGDAGCLPLDLDTYWRLKRLRTGVGVLLAKSRCAAISSAEFERRWLRLIERPSYLALDVVQDGAVQKLRHWNRQGFHLILASMRRNRQRAVRQVRQLGISRLFETMAFSSPTAGPEGKAAGVVAVLRRDASPGIWIGDTEADIRAAAIAGFRSVAVSCGIRSRPVLVKMNADLVVPRIAAIRRDQIYQSLER